MVHDDGNPTSKEIQQHWEKAGRRGNASPILAGLQKTGQLKRIPIPGQHSSHHVLKDSAGAAARAAAAPLAKPAIRPHAPSVAAPPANPENLHCGVLTEHMQPCAQPL